MPSSDPRDLHASIEVPNWAPWLRFSAQDLSEYNAVFPDGQVVHLLDDRAVGMLTSVLIRWDGDPATLMTWDEVSGHDGGIAAAHDPQGNTMVMLSVSVHPDRHGHGVPADLVATARRVADRLGLDHLISAFRPSGYGRFKAEGGAVDFDAYVAARRPDGLPVDPWLRNLTRLGMEPLVVCRGAMVAPVTVAEMEALRSTHHPSRWSRLDPARTGTLLARVPDHLVSEVDEVWECGETGSWFVDHAADRATYVEDNLWGELPIRAPRDRRPTTEVRLTAATDLSASLMDAAARLTDDEVVAVWLEGRDPRAQVVRSLEAEAFPDIEAFLGDDVEQWCRFLVIIDLAEQPRIGQAFRVSSHRYGPPGSPAVGMPTVDEIVATNDDVTLDGVLAHYEGEGIDLRANIAVESSFRVDGPRKGARGLRWSDHGYVELFREAKRGASSESEERGVFAHVNEATVRSLAGIGISVARFAGRDDLHSPASQPGTHDDRYVPAYITARHQNGVIFSSLEELAAAAFDLDPDEVEVVIDLRDGTGPDARTGSDQAREQPVHE